jgi:hypothetical protein
MRRHICDVGPVETDGTPRNRVRTRNRAQQRGFSSAVGADKSHYLALGHRERDLADGL